MTKRSKNPVLILPTAAEDAAINAGIAQDPDTVELTAESAAELQPLRQPGRPEAEQPKGPGTMGENADVLAAIGPAEPGGGPA